MKEKQLVFYQDQAGNEPFKLWLNGFRDASIRRRILQRLFRVQSGNYGDYQPVKGGIFERRLHFGSGYRIYFGEDGEKIVVLLCGGDKSKQKKDIETAKEGVFK
jgi:putative addiction module killer protein